MYRINAIEIIAHLIGDSNIAVISNLGPTSNDLKHTSDRARNLYTYGGMGLCSSIALGASLGTQGKVLSLDGDGSLLMNLGTLASIGREKPQNLIIVAFDNVKWAHTGNQLSNTSFGTDLEEVSKACGIAQTVSVSSEQEFARHFEIALNNSGPWFILAKIEESENLPFPPILPEINLTQFRATFLTK